MRIFNAKGINSAAYPKVELHDWKLLQCVLWDHLDIIHMESFLTTIRDSIQTYPLNSFNLYMKIFYQNTLNTSIG